MGKTSVRGEKKLPGESEAPYVGARSAPSRKLWPAKESTSATSKGYKLQVMERLCNICAHCQSENRTHAARELFNDRPARTLL